jgi:hypothetical protein
VVFEAAKGYRYGLPYHAALASVTSAPAELLGMGERIGKVKNGFDADIVVWDSDPLSVGATPVQVWIDGTAQFPDAIALDKPISDPITPNEALGADIKDDSVVAPDVVFSGVSQIMIPGLEQSWDEKPANVVIKGGDIICIGLCDVEINAASTSTEFVDLRNGHLSPSFTAFGSSIGLTEISSEAATQNGKDSSEVFSRAVDGLQLDGKNTKISYAHGVTKAISAPVYQGGGRHGVSAGFSMGALQPLEKGAVWADEVSVHYTLSAGAKQGKTPSISSAVGALRKNLLKAIAINETEEYSEASYLKKVVSGHLPLVIAAQSADTIAAIIRVKSEVEAAIKTANPENPASIRLVLLGAAESHLVAKEIAAANISVVLSPAFSYAKNWDERRALTGAPLTNGTTIDALIDAGVLTALSTAESWEIRDLSLLAGIAYKNGGGKLSQTDALNLIGGNFDTILGIKTPEDFVVFEGNPLEIDSRVKAVGSQGFVSIY